MNAELKDSKGHHVPNRQLRRRKCQGAGALGKKHESLHASEGTEDLVRIARSIGFSMREASEIGKIYQSTPKGKLK